jgi:hypothetical protein
MVRNGLTVAIIAGVPLVMLVGQGFGWWTTFLTVAGLAALSPLGAALKPVREMRVLLLAIRLWRLANWGLITAQQVRLLALARYWHRSVSR